MVNYNDWINKANAILLNTITIADKLIKNFDLERAKNGLATLVQWQKTKDQQICQSYNILDLVRLSQCYFDSSKHSDLVEYLSQDKSWPPPIDLTVEEKFTNYWTPKIIGKLDHVFDRGELYSYAGIMKEFERYKKELGDHWPDYLEAIKACEKYPVDFYDVLYLLEFFAHAPANANKHTHNKKHLRWLESSIMMASRLYPWGADKTFNLFEAVFLYHSQTIMKTSNWYSQDSMFLRFPCVLLFGHPHKLKESQQLVMRCLESHAGTSYNITGLPFHSEEELLVHLTPILNLINSQNLLTRGSTVNIVCSINCINHVYLANIHKKAKCNIGFEITLLIYCNDFERIAFPPSNPELYIAHCVRLIGANHRTTAIKPLVTDLPLPNLDILSMDLKKEQKFSSTSYIKLEKNALKQRAAHLGWSGNDGFQVDLRKCEERWDKQIYDSPLQSHRYHENKLKGKSINLCTEIKTPCGPNFLGLCKLTTIAIPAMIQFVPCGPDLKISRNKLTRIISSLADYEFLSTIRALTDLEADSDMAHAMKYAVFAVSNGLNMSGDSVIHAFLEASGLKHPLTEQSPNDLARACVFDRWKIASSRGTYWAKMVKKSMEKKGTVCNHEWKFFDDYLSNWGHPKQFLGSTSCVPPSSGSIERQLKTNVPGTILESAYELTHECGGGLVTQRSSAAITYMYTRLLDLPIEDTIKMINETFKILTNPDMHEHTPLAIEVQESVKLQTAVSVQEYFLEIKQRSLLISDAISSFVPISDDPATGKKQLVDTIDFGEGIFPSLLYYGSHTNHQASNLLV